MTTRDSVEKVITRYFTAVTAVPFDHRGTTYQPQNLQVSEGIFWKTMKCPAGCGACCPRFSLDYTQFEYDALPPAGKAPLTERVVEFNEARVVMWSDLQNDHQEHHCRNLDMGTGLCGIHGRQPFSCDFELMRFFTFGERGNRLDHARYGRAWAMKRVDGERGALCEWTKERASAADLADVVRKLERLDGWGRYFGLSTVVPEIINWLGNGPHKRPLRIEHTKPRGFGF